MQQVAVVGVRGCDIRPSGTGLEFQLQLWGFTAKRLMFIRKNMLFWPFYSVLVHFLEIYVP